MVNEHIVDYYPSPSELTSRILRSHISLDSQRVYLLRIFLQFFLKPVYPIRLWKNFKFLMLRLLENTFVNQKIESVHLYSCSQAKLSLRFLSSPLQAEGNYPFPTNNVF